MVFEVGIGTSQNWNPEEAAKEVITQALSKLSKPPTFVLLFSTIHHEKNRGFQKILDTIYQNIPKETPLVGGTVTGFLTANAACTQGIAAAAIYSDELDFEIGFGINTKRNPKNAARNCIKKIKNFKFKFQNKLLLLITSGPSYPIMPGIGKIKVVKNPFLRLLLPSIIKLSTLVIQKGLGREQEIAEEIRKQLPDFSVFGGSTNDDNNYTRNYQFFFDKVLQNTVIALGLSTNFNVFMDGGHGLQSTGINGTIQKKALWDYLIKDFDGVDAQKKYLEANGWDEKVLDEFIHRKTIYYPIGIYFPDGTLHPYPVPIFTGKEIILGHTARGNKFEFLTTSGEKLLNSLDPLILNIQEPAFLFGVSCAVRLETLGRNIFKTRDKLLQKTNDFLLIYTVGETRGKPNAYIHQLQETINLLSISRKNPAITDK
ncbi:MAG: FIST N-terminal domain-containing protein [Candidatus ainarchaeum sp.]|nr:FIST N-terminal domain-containing protein [Candidatus ainarchaeum sp.]